MSVYHNRLYVVHHFLRDLHVPVLLYTIAYDLRIRGMPLLSHAVPLNTPVNIVFCFTHIPLICI